MKNTNFVRLALASGSAIVVSLTATSPASGQNASNAANASEAEAPAGGEIIVTGSRIVRPNDQSPAPITSVAPEELTLTGRVSVGDTLNDLPSLRNTFSQQNSTRFLGTTGLNLLDLRGLGPQRTLVLVNGRRHVGADILGNAVSTDINTLPTDLIDRIDIVTGGNSAVYGSDAVAGVVNFILKDHYDGLQMHAQGGISSRADAGAYFASLLAGRNFAGGRGNIAVNLEYARQNDTYASDRSYLLAQQAFVTVDSDPAGTPNGSDGVPDRLLFSDVRSATLANGGLVSFASPSGACGRDSAGAAYNCTFLFQPDGTLTPQTGTRVGLAPNGNYLGGNGTTGREGKLLQIEPQLNRYSANLVGHFEISPALIPFVEASYVRTDTLRSASGPAFTQGTTFGGDPRERPRLDNPFLNPQARALITSSLIAAGTNPAAISGATRFSLRENLVGLGLRQEQARRETYRIVGGLRGTFNSDWHYELSANYGEFDERTKVLGNLNLQRYLLAIDSVTNANGQIVCRSQVNPAAALAYDDTNALSNSTLAADVAACVPLNPFGPGAISAAAKNYAINDTVSVGKITQFVATGFVSGDTSGFLNLPGGPVGVAAGAEYRRETAFYRQDPLIENGLTFYNVIPTFAPPAFDVKEGFAEVRLPILKDRPFFHDLSVEASARVADYGGRTGTVYAYSAGGDWAPIRDIRFRANYSRSVRAPNLADLYTPQGQNFTPGAPAFFDPCSARNIGAGPATRATNCASAGRPAGYDYVYTASLEIVSGGNPDLREETSDSYTFGVVATPRFVPGLSLSVDYYNITVDGVITAPTAQDIVNACYDASSLNNQFCSLFQRAGANGGAHGEIPFQIIEGSLQQTTLNYAALKVRGLDVDLSYRHKFGFGTLMSHLEWTHVLQNDQFLDPTDPGRADQINGELGDPKDAFNWTFGLQTGPLSLTYQLRYISPMALLNWEDAHSVQGRPPENADYGLPSEYPDVFYQNVRVGVSVNKRYDLYLGVDNIADRRPPLGLTGQTDGGGIYDARGRYFYAGFTARF